jgi:predicted ferric reductase
VVSTVQVLGQNVTEIVLSPLDKMLTHLPGQFAMLSFVDGGIIPREEHPFTISSSYNNGDIRFSIKAIGDYTKTLPNLKLGTLAAIEGAFGEFSYLYGNEKQIWVAGGIGVTPFVSMAEDLLQKETIEYNIDFFYSVRTVTDGVYQELFESVAKKHSSFIFHYMPSDIIGHITGDSIVKEFSDIKQRDIFICGPPPMMSSLIQSLKTLGVKSDNLHSERFALL